jgi:chaperonin GroEL
MRYKKSKIKQILSNKEQINDKVLRSIKTISTIVGSSLGPGGRPSLLERDDMPPLITKDGVTIARHLGAKDAIDNLIIDAAKDICINTAKEAGDGTTSAIVIAAAIVEAGQRVLQTEQINPQLLMRKISALYSDVVKGVIKNTAMDLSGVSPKECDDYLMGVASVSANGDEELAKVSVEAVLQAGEDGHILIEENDSIVTEVEPLNGYCILRGLKDIGQLGHMFENKNQRFEADNGLVFLFNGSVTDLSVPSCIQDIFEAEGKEGTPTVVIAHGFSDMVIERFAKTTKAGSPIIPIQVQKTGAANSGIMFLKDMAAYTGGKVFDVSNFEEMELHDFGTFEKAYTTMYETFIISDPDDEKLQSRIQEIREVEKDASSQFEKSIEASILREALSKPLELVLSNCGVDDIEKITKKYSKKVMKTNEVFDANLFQFVDAFETKLVEPAKVVRVSIENAISVASLLITLGGIVVKPRNEELEQQMEMTESLTTSMMSGLG